jgi:hypothetical protein
MKLSLVLLAVLPLSAWAYPSHHWVHRQSLNFTLSANEQTEVFADRALAIAEETRKALTGYFGDGDDTRRLAIVLTDDADESNGEASTSDPVVTIECRKTQMLLRGESDWLRTVVTHELSHLYSIRQIRRWFVVRSGWGIDSTAGNFSVQSRSNPDPVSLPVWFVEGLAQMGSRRVVADSHDPVRQMILGDALRSGRLLTLEEMARFEGTSVDAELAYNQGFSLLLYWEQAFPQAPLSRLCPGIPALGFEAAVKEATGLTLGQVYTRWKASLAGGDRTGTPGQRLFAVQSPMVVETASAGDFVVANWDNDYQRFGLFHRRPDGGFDAVARDTGTEVRWDARTGTAWFTRLTYEGSGTVYEVFRRTADGRLLQETRDARVLAFDVADGTLAYARYRNGATDLVVRSPDKTEAVLGSFPPGTAVYGLRLVTPGSALVTLGTGTDVEVGILAAGGYRPLWPGSSILDACPLGQDRILFSSTLDGSPQLYWADTAEDPDTWYQLTDAPGGARFPDGSDLGRVTYSEYTRGGWYRCLVADPFSRARPVKAPVPILPAAPAVRPPEPAPPAQVPAPVNLVVHADPVFFGWFGDQGRLPTDEVGTAWSAVVGWSAGVYDAPGDWGLSASVQTQLPFHTVDPSNPTTQGSLAFSTDLGPVRTNLSLSRRFSSTYYNKQGFEFRTFEDSSTQAQAALQLTEDQTLTAFGTLTVDEETTVSPRMTYFQDQSAGLAWSLARAPVSAFDPARLGGTAYQAWARAEVHAVDSHLWDAARYLTNPGPVTRLSGGLAGRLLALDSRVSLTADVDGLWWAGAADGSHLTPNLLPTLGGPSWFSGYPSGYARVTSLARGILRVGTNPLADKARKTEGFQRLGLFAQVEAGWGQFFVTEGLWGLRSGTPVSAEIGLQVPFYDLPQNLTVWDFRFALALQDPVASAGGSALSLPFQLWVTLAE